MENFFDQYFTSNFMQSLINFVIALLVLLVGWLIAKAIGNAVAKMLSKTKWDDKLLSKFRGDTEESAESGKRMDSNEIIGKIVYYFLFILVIIIFLNMLNLNMLAGPLSDLISTILGIIPAILKAALIFAAAWVIATIVQWLIADGTKRFNISHLFFKMRVAKTEEEIDGYIKTIGKVAFYLILLLFLPAVLNALEIQGVAEPVTGLLASILGFIPNLLAAALVFAVGWFVAKITKNIVKNLLMATGSEKLVEKFKLQKVFNNTTLAGFVGNLIFILILIPVTIAALERLQLAGITDPAISMLDQVLSMIPNIAVAVALILVGVWLGKLIGGFVSDFMENIGFNGISKKLGVKETTGMDKLTPAALVGYIVQVLIVFFLTIQALHVLQLDFLVGIATAITAYIPMVLAAVLTLGVALIVANIVERILKNVLVGPASRTLAVLAKYTIITIAVFMVLTQLGIAPTIVNAAFILILGALALAFGLAFGLGGKDFANKYLRKADSKLEEMSVKENKDPVEENRNPQDPMDN